MLENIRNLAIVRTVLPARSGSIVLNGSRYYGILPQASFGGAAPALYLKIKGKNVEWLKNVIYPGMLVVKNCDMQVLYGDKAGDGPNGLPT